MNPRFSFRLQQQKLPPSEGIANKVYVVRKTVTKEYHEDPVTGIKTLIESSVSDSSSPDLFCFCIDSSTSHSQVSDLLYVHLVNDRWLCNCLASRIASAAIKLGLGVNGFEIVLVVTETRQKVVSPDSYLQKLVCQGTIDGGEQEMSKIGKEPCSICLENLSGSKIGVPTRMPCSHVFHDRCLLEWFCRKDTCPICRRVLTQ